jgi:hypothetical protein
MAREWSDLFVVDGMPAGVRDRSSSDQGAGAGSGEAAVE